MTCVDCKHSAVSEIHGCVNCTESKGARYKNDVCASFTHRYEDGKYYYRRNPSAKKRPVEMVCGRVIFTRNSFGAKISDLPAGHVLTKKE